LFTHDKRVSRLNFVDGIEQRKSEIWAFGFSEQKLALMITSDLLLSSYRIKAHIQARLSIDYSSKLRTKEI
jgi:hypothetical protein